MYDYLTSALISASEQLLAETYVQLESTEESVVYVELSSEQTKLLARKILVLPEDDIAILLLHYALGMDFEAIARVLKQDLIRGKLSYSERLLSTGMGLSEAERIGHHSLRSACQVALKGYTDFPELYMEASPRYSRSFMKTMRRINAVRNPLKPIYRILQRAAIFLVVFGISFGIALSVNAELRASVYRWFVETFPQFSNFSLQSGSESEEPSYEELLLYEPTFIPDGYIEMLVENFPPSVFHVYKSDAGDLLGIIGNMPDGDPISLNTEGVEMEITTFRGEEAFYWEKDGVSYFSFIINSYQFNISAHLKRDVIMKIAENIKKM